MNKLTLSGKLGLAFGSLILLTILLGGLAVWRINLAASSAADVAAMHAPEVRVAYNVHEAAWKTRFFVRSYALTGNESYLPKARERLAILKDQLKAADELAKKFPELDELDRGEAEALRKTIEFEGMLDRIEAEFKNIDVQEAALDAAAKVFIRNCLALRASQQRKLWEEIRDKADAAKLVERAAKLALVGDLIDAGNAIRIANFKAQAANDVQALEGILQDFTVLDGIAARIAPMLHQQENIDHLAKIREAAGSYKAAMEKALKARATTALITASLAETADAVTGKAAEVVATGLNSIGKAATDVAGGLSLARLILLVGSLVALLAGIVIARRSARSITTPIHDGINAIASTAAQISATIAELASNSSETAAAVAETTTTVEEVRQTAQVTAEKAKAVADSAKGAASAAEAGRLATGQTAQGLDLIRSQMGEIGENITRLNEQSQAVGEIVSTVADLAEQSNLLAVNAAIEAAKAGEMGRGFAVVAQEIRSLAEQSKDSTKQVRTILTEVRKATGKAVVASEQGDRIVAEGGRQADEAGRSITDLAATVQDSMRAAVQIAASSQQQLVGMDQVGRAMENIKNATLQNAEGARQLGSAAHNLQDIGTRLRKLVGSEADEAHA
jgi:methyl-accepting chemotaxis protein